MAGGLLALAALGSCAQTPASDCSAVTLDVLDARLATAFCGCASGLATLALGHVPADCIGEMTAFFAEGQIGHLRASVAAGTVTFRPEEAAAGVCALEACDPSVFDGGRGYRIAMGSSVDGGPCAYDDDCSLTSVCRSGSGCTGTCMHLPRIGDACTTDSDCSNPVAFAAPLPCGPLGTCVARPALGETCRASSGCASGLTCAQPTGMEGTCVEPPPHRLAGEACGPAMCPPGFSSCAPITCAPGLVCVDVGPGVVPTCHPALTDGTCRAVYDYQGRDCPVGDTCVGASPGVTGTCTPPPGLRAPCASALATCADGLRCQGGTLSSGGTCEVVGHVGDACSQDWSCISEFCDAGHCAIPPACR